MTTPATPSLRSSVLGAAVVFLLALAPRVVDHERFITFDEGGKWFARTQDFYDGLKKGDLAATAQAPHPGVTTMWLGAAGLAAWDATGHEPPTTPDERHAWRMAQRTPVSIVTAATVALGWLLLRRLFAPAVAATAAVLWALDPFVAAHSRILHVDGLVTGFCSVALLAALVAWNDDGRTPPRAFWLLSAVAGGLALLSKLSAVFVLPAVAVIAFSATSSGPGTLGERLRAGLVGTGKALGGWLAVAGLVIVALWPALWVDPLRAFDEIRFGATLGVSAHERGNYFLGAYVDDPGPLFYPVVVALRTVPWTTLGLLVGVPLALAQKGAARRLLVAAAILGLGMTVSPKKFDRYALPLFPALDVLAAVGWAGAVEAARKRLGGEPDGRDAFALIGGSLVAGTAYLVWCHPDELAAYNPMFGGTKTAEYALLVGWGEGTDEVGDYIREHTTDCANTVASPIRNPIEPWVCNPLVPPTKARTAEFVVLYINSTQRRQYPSVLAKYERLKPEFVVERHGVQFAAVYRNPPPKPKPKPKPAP